MRCRWIWQVGFPKKMRILINSRFSLPSIIHYIEWRVPMRFRMPADDPAFRATIAQVLLPKRAQPPIKVWCPENHSKITHPRKAVALDGVG